MCVLCVCVCVCVCAVGTVLEANCCFTPSPLEPSFRKSEGGGGGKAHGLFC